MLSDGTASRFEAGRVQEALATLYGIGARFILLEGKQPSGGKSGLYDRRRPSIEEAFNHFCANPWESDRDIAIEPASIGYAVVDVDGVRKTEGRVPDGSLKATEKAVIDRLGPQSRAFPSMSGGGKCHVWRKIDAGAEAPLGVKDDGKPYLAAPTDMYFDARGPGSGSAFDIRFKHSYVRVTNYLVELARYAAGDDSDPSAEWLKLIRHGKRWKPVKPEPPRPVLPAEPISDEQAERMNRAYIEKLPALAEGSRHNILNEAGYKAGQEAAWNPRFIGMLEEWALARVPKSKARQLRKAYADGMNNPVGKPESKRPGPSANGRPALPPVEAYEKEAEAAAASGESPTEELSLARSFVRSARGRLLFDVETGKWMAFDKGWKKSIKEPVIVRVRQFVANSNPEPEEPKMRNKFNAEGLGTRIYKMSSELTAVAGSERFDLDDALVGFPGGGIAEIITGKIRAAAKEDMVSIETGCAPKEGPTPRFDAFLEETFGGDADTIRYLCRFFGYCLTGSTEEHKALFFQGAPATGKSAFIEIVKLVFGGYCKAINSKTFVSGRSDEHPTIVANLRGPPARDLRRDRGQRPGSTTRC